MKKVFRSRLNFSKAELRGNVNIANAGVSMPIPGGNFREGYESRKNWLSFGSLFGSLNDPKYYEDLQARDVAPKAEDFIEAPFRLISATTVGAGTWKATDFSNAAVLKASYPMLEGKPLYKDHETDLDNWVGLVTGVKWTNAFTSNGIKVPAGIDGIVAIDAKTNPKVARGVLMGSVFSNSVTVEFDWEMSHDFESEWDFYDRVGTMGSDGKMIRRIVKEIFNYHESSLVWLGADPFAKAYDTDGNLKNIDTGSVYEFTKALTHLTKDAEKISEENEDVKEVLKNTNRYTINFGIDKSILPLTRQGTYNKQPEHKPEQKPEKTIGMKKEFLLAFIADFGTHFNLAADAEPTTDEMIGYLKKLSFVSDADKEAYKNKATLADKFMKVALAQAQVTDADKKTISMSESMAMLDTHGLVLSSELTSLRADAKLGQAQLTAQRDEVIRLYKVTVGEDKADAAVIDMFNKADKAALDGFLKQYTKEATTGKFSGKCKKCGSTEFSFQSSVNPDGGESDESEEDADALSSEDLRKRYSKSEMSIGRRAVQEEK